ncbi:MAG TPA: AAA family ATPase [Methanosarcinales archaeon]|nr:AAA family ATPase [Methanosarcinales archaeon]
MTTDEINEVILRVAEARHRDAGRGIARIGKDAMQKLGLVTGDVIEIRGKGIAPAIVWPAYPEDSDGIMRIDGNIRSNAGVGIDERVKIRRVDASEGSRIVIASTQPIKIIGGSEYLRKILEGRPVVRGQRIRVEMLGSPLTFVVKETQPSGVVISTKTTQITLKEKTIEEKRPATYISYEDIGGLRREVGLVREMVELPFRHPELFQKVGINPPKGVLLYGPPGTGKTVLAKALANETDASFIFISGPEIMAKHYGESEQRLRAIFEEAEANAPSIIFIDEFDSIAAKRDDVSGEKQLERRVVAQMLALMDGLKARGDVIVIAATNKPNLIDEALRRGGRFDREIEIGIPDRNGRLEILEIHTRGMPLGEEVRLDELADHTHGFVGADIESLCKEAAMHALRKILPEIDIETEIPAEVIDRLTITEEDFDEALKSVEPSAMREVFIEVPQVEWEDIGGLEDAKQDLIEAVEWPLRYPEAFAALRSKPPKGILLFGPPGTGKTMLAKAAATESEANFISIRGPELFSRYVGESEKAVRETFRKAKQAAPAVIFFDEIDSIAPVRGASSDSHVTERVASQILIELDGMEELKNVVIIAATNRPDIIDPALLRPGRFDRLIYIRPPDAEGREKIFRIHLDEKPLADDVEIRELARMTDGYVGADIDAICREASMLTLRDFIKPDMDREFVKSRAYDLVIKKNHLEMAIRRVRPTASKSKLEKYESIAEEFVKEADMERNI